MHDLRQRRSVFVRGDARSAKAAKDRARIYTDEQTNIRLLQPGEDGADKDRPTRAARTTDEHQTQRGFTLLEVLIALAIVAVSVGALLGTVTSSASNIIYLKDKTLAEWVALNRLTEIRIAQQMPDPGKRTGNAEMGGMRWQWEEEVVELPVKGMFRVDMRARPTGETVDDSRQADEARPRRQERDEHSPAAANSRSSAGPRRSPAWLAARRSRSPGRHRHGAARHAGRPSGG